VNGAVQRAWVGVVSRAHVRLGVEGGFAQLCHGKRGPLARIGVGDWLVYYSPRAAMADGAPLRAFTAIGRVVGEAAAPVDMGGGFVPFRRAVAYERAREVPFVDLKGQLTFARDRAWGRLARRGVFEIPLSDALVLARAMCPSSRS
jgi:EVE domain-containing protein